MGAAPWSLPLSAFPGETGCGGCGEICPPLRPSVSLCRECSSACGSGRCTGTLFTPYLTKKGPFTICSGTPGKTPEPFPLHGSPSRPCWGARLPLPSPAVSLPRIRFLLHCSHAPPLPAGTPRGSCHPCRVPVASCSLSRVSGPCRSPSARRPLPHGADAAEPVAPPAAARESAHRRPQRPRRLRAELHRRGNGFRSAEKLPGVFCSWAVLLPLLFVCLVTHASKKLLILFPYLCLKDP